MIKTIVLITGMILGYIIKWQQERFKKAKEQQKAINKTMRKINRFGPF